MKTPQSKTTGSLFSSAVKMTTPTLALLLLAAVPCARAQGNDNRAPAVPANLLVPPGNKVSFHAYAVGVQIYVWTINPTNAALNSWAFHAPQAVLYDSDGNVVGIHYAYAGPTRPAWQTESGSLVVGARLAASTVHPPVDTNAIPWLKLQTVLTDGHGVLARTTYIQRVNTAGGQAPATAGSAAGQVSRVPYTAEYYFYRADQSAAATE